MPSMEQTSDIVNFLDAVERTGKFSKWKAELFIKAGTGAEQPNNYIRNACANLWATDLSFEDKRTILIEFVTRRLER